MTEKRNIKTIAPFLADNFVDFDEQIFDIDLYSKFLNDNSNILKNFNKYLFCLLHDSWIIDLEIKSDILILTLNDFSTHVFADAIVDKFNIDIEHEKLIFPLILELKGNLSI